MLPKASSKIRLLLLAKSKAWASRVWANKVMERPVLQQASGDGEQLLVQVTCRRCLLDSEATKSRHYVRRLLRCVRGSAASVPSWTMLGGSPHNQTRF